MFRVLGIYNFGEPVEFDRFFSLEFRPGGTFSNQMGTEQTYHTHYTLSVAIEMVHLFAPSRGSRQLWVPLAAQCGLAEGVYHTNRVVKRILGSLYHTWPEQILRSKLSK